MMDNTGRGCVTFGEVAWLLERLREFNKINRFNKRSEVREWLSDKTTQQSDLGPIKIPPPVPFLFYTSVSQPSTAKRRGASIVGVWYHNQQKRPSVPDYDSASDMPAFLPMARLVAHLRLSPSCAGQKTKHVTWKYENMRQGLLLSTYNQSTPNKASAIRIF